MELLCVESKCSFLVCRSDEDLLQLKIELMSIVSDRNRQHR